MYRLSPAVVVFALTFLIPPLSAQKPITNKPAGLKVQFRSAKSSNRFRVGEEIRLEAVFSSSKRHRYLEPCELWSNRTFGVAKCRFFTPWSFTITPDAGWVDLWADVLHTTGGPMVEVPNRDLTSKPAAFSYLLTQRYRFDLPGEYKVRLSMKVALDDESTRAKLSPNPHTVDVTREIVLQIVPAER